MSDPVSIYVPGKPRSQPRGRPVVHCALASKRGGKKCPAVVVSTMKDETKAYRNTVLKACRDAARNPDAMKLLASKEALKFHMVLFFETDKHERWNTPHVFVPDADNCGKLLQDCAVDAGLIKRGDGRVSDLRVVKMWSHKPGALLSIAPLSEDEMMEIIERIAGGEG